MLTVNRESNRGTNRSPKGIVAGLMFMMMTIVSVMALSMTTSTARAADGESTKYALDKAHTAIYFKIEHMGMSYTFGRFNEFDGEFTLAGGDSQFTMTIKAESIDTGNAKRDDHLRGSDFFNVKQFPTIEFVTKNVVVEGDMYHAEGDLTLHGITKSVTIPFQKLADGKARSGKKKTGFVSEFTIKRSDFGMMYGQGAMGDDVTLAVSFEGEAE